MIEYRNFIIEYNHPTWVLIWRQHVYHFESQYDAMDFIDREVLA